MNETLKAAKLDFSLIRPYLKNLCFNLALPVLFAAINKSLFTGISFAMCIIAITVVYPFSISEKNGVDRLYGILPISRRNLVLGRYLYTCSMGLLTLLFSCMIHPIVLRAVGVTVSPSDICLAAIMGIIMFTLYTVFQLPGYYKYGSIKGKGFLFVPVAGYLTVLFLFSKSATASYAALYFLVDHPMMSVMAALFSCIIAFLFSIAVSLHVVENKEV